MASSDPPLPEALSSKDFYIAAGTLAVDPRYDKVLLVRHENGTLHLPRGRCDWGEPPIRTALRETLEEAGFRVRVIAAPIHTRATAPRGAHKPWHRHHRIFKAGNRVDEDIWKVKIKEPFYQLRHLRGNGAHATVFIFLAVGDSTAEPKSREAAGQEADENYTGEWTHYADIPYPDWLYEEIVKEGIRIVNENKAYFLDELNAPTWRRVLRTLRSRLWSI